MSTVIWELFHFNSESKINWDLKQVTLKHDVRYIYNTLYHYKAKIDIVQTQHELHQYKNNWEPLNYKSLKNRWNDQKKVFLDIWNIDFTELKEKVDYILTPLYKTEKIYIIGIILLTLDTKIIKKLMKTCKQPTIYNFLSQIKGDLQFNIIKGVLEHLINQVKDKYICINLTNSVTNSNNQINLYLEEIFYNIRNYFPKIQIEYTKQQQNIFYKVFSKSSKSIMLPTSLPATLSATS
jgi:hypothetical protein